MSNQNANPLKSILRTAADGIGHVAQTTRGRLAALIPGQDPSRASGQAAWDARVAIARADTEAFARGERIAAQFAEHLDKVVRKVGAAVLTTTDGRSNPSCRKCY